MADWIAPVDTSETPAEYVIQVEIPEVKKEDVKVVLEHGMLTVQGLRRQEAEEQDNKYHRVERSYGSFMRSFSLPNMADDKKVQTDLKDGLLSLRLPKSDKAKTKAIEVQVAPKAFERDSTLTVPSMTSFCGCVVVPCRPCLTNNLVCR